MSCLQLAHADSPLEPRSFTEVYRFELDSDGMGSVSGRIASTAKPQWQHARMEFARRTRCPLWQRLEHLTDVREIQDLHLKEEALEHGSSAGVAVTQMGLKSCRRCRRDVEVSTSISWSFQFGATKLRRNFGFGLLRLQAPPWPRVCATRTRGGPRPAAFLTRMRSAQILWRAHSLVEQTMSPSWWTATPCTISAAAIWASSAHRTLTYSACFRWSFLY